MVVVAVWLCGVLDVVPLWLPATSRSIPIPPFDQAWTARPRRTIAATTPWFTASAIYDQTCRRMRTWRNSCSACSGRDTRLL